MQTDKLKRSWILFVCLSLMVFVFYFVRFADFYISFDQDIVRQQYISQLQYNQMLVQGQGDVIKQQNICLLPQEEQSVYGTLLVRAVTSNAEVQLVQEIYQKDASKKLYYFVTHVEAKKKAYEKYLYRLYYPIPTSDSWLEVLDWQCFSVEKMNERRVLEEIQLERGLDGEFLFVPASDSASNEIELAMLYQVKNDAPLYVGISTQLVICKNQFTHSFGMFSNELMAMYQ